MMNIVRSVVACAAIIMFADIERAAAADCLFEPSDPTEAVLCARENCKRARMSCEERYRDSPESIVLCLFYTRPQCIQSNFQTWSIIDQCRSANQRCCRYRGSDGRVDFWTTQEECQDLRGDLVSAEMCTVERPSANQCIQSALFANRAAKVKAKLEAQSLFEDGLAFIECMKSQSDPRSCIGYQVLSVAPPPPDPYNVLILNSLEGDQRKALLKHWAVALKQRQKWENEEYQYLVEASKRADSLANSFTDSLIDSPEAAGRLEKR